MNSPSNTEAATLFAVLSSISLNLDYFILCLILNGNINKNKMRLWNSLPHPALPRLGYLGQSEGQSHKVGNVHIIWECMR